MTQVKQTNPNLITVQEFGYLSKDFKAPILDTFVKATLQKFKLSGVNWQKQLKEFRVWDKDLRTYFNIP